MFFLKGVLGCQRDDSAVENIGCSSKEPGSVPRQFTTGTPVLGNLRLLLASLPTAHTGVHNPAGTKHSYNLKKKSFKKGEF